MRDYFRFDRRDLIPFLVCTIIYAAIFFLWTVVPLNGGVSLADSDSVAAGVPVLGDLPTQSISKLVISGALYLMAVVYGLWSIAASEHRRTLPQFVGYGLLSLVAWMMLNFWVVSGFLNSPSVLLYSAASIVLLLVWGGATARFVAQLHDAMALFLVRFGLGLG